MPLACHWVLWSCLLNHKMGGFFSVSRDKSSLWVGKGHTSICFYKTILVKCSHGILKHSLEIWNWVILSHIPDDLVPYMGLWKHKSSFWTQREGFSRWNGKDASSSEEGLLAVSCVNCDEHTRESNTIIFYFWIWRESHWQEFGSPHSHIYLTHSLKNDCPRANKSNGGSVVLGQC